VGWRRTILHYDGTPAQCRAEYSRPSRAFGQCRDEVFVVEAIELSCTTTDPLGSHDQSDGRTATRRLGRSESDVLSLWAGTILRHCGDQWGRMTVHGGFLAELWAVQVAPCSQWLGRTILRYNGAEWTGMASGVNGDLYTVWVFPRPTCCGRGGRRWMGDPTFSTTMAVRGARPLPHSLTRPRRRYLGSSGSDVFLVGEQGLILHFDGTAWGQMESQTGLPAACGVVLRQASSPWARRRILHYNGSSWSFMDSGSSVNLRAIWGPRTATCSPWAMVARSCTTMARPGADGARDEQALFDVWGSSGGNVFAVGTGGRFLLWSLGATAFLMPRTAERKGRVSPLAVALAAVIWADLPLRRPHRDRQRRRPRPSLNDPTPVAPWGATRVPRWANSASTLSGTRPVCGEASCSATYDPGTRVLRPALALRPTGGVLGMAGPHP